ncbi:hypothetical protein EVG20_g10562 [Dentipellis fragilis]|uniref:Uncharacterized protein n=1 Tax=Dentipellis fragilis TaxID=205917 RepID=A0A4Y9XQP6_9AGAM|nr:hypothetical protein EVG20_g10562 [Dentipellis fragilis]
MPITTRLASTHPLRRPASRLFTLTRPRPSPHPVSQDNSTSTSTPTRAPSYSQEARQGLAARSPGNTHPYDAASPHGVRHSSHPCGGNPEQIGFADQNGGQSAFGSRVEEELGGRVEEELGARKPTTEGEREK